MSRGISLQQYFTLKEKSIKQVFFFLLDKEYHYLDNETTWLQSLRLPAYVIRMPVDDFHQMDFAVHPKVICTKQGKELFEINGLPSLKYLQHKLSL